MAACDLFESWTERLREKNEEDEKFGKYCNDYNCTLYSHYVGKPFAEGAFRYAFRGRYCRGAVKCGKNVGDPCVVKKWKNQHVYDKSFWQRDLQMSKVAQQMAQGWNRMGKISKEYVVLQPKITHSIEKNTNESNENEIQENEFTLTEDYVSGNFEKWNSNSGWYNNQFIDSSIQAFCHWTYHFTDGNLLFCDAQGVRKENSYIITDPCILSDKAGRFGSTDCGHNYIINWFKNHKCNKYCEKHWKRANGQMTEKVVAIQRTSFAFETIEYQANNKHQKNEAKMESKKFDVSSVISHLDSIDEE